MILHKIKHNLLLYYSEKQEINLYTIHMKVNLYKISTYESSICSEPFTVSCRNIHTKDSTHCFSIIRINIVALLGEFYN